MNFKKIKQLVFKAVALGMGVATLVLSVIGDLQAEQGITFLAIGLIALAMNALEN